MSDQTLAMMAGITQGLSFVMMILGCVLLSSSIWSGNIVGAIMSSFIGACGVILFLTNRKVIQNIMED